MSGHPDIQAFLKEHPWPAEWQNKGPFLHRLWVWDFPVSMEALWPHLADTSTFNKRLGLGEMKFREENGRLQGEAVNLGIKSVWEEIPWEWEYGRTLSNLRVYSRGFGKAVRSVYSVEALPSGGVRLFVYFGWVLDGILGRLLLPQSMRWLKKRYDVVLGEIVTRLQKKIIFPPPEPPPVLSPESLGRLDAARQELIQKKCPADLVDRVLEWIRTCPDNELLRIRPREIAAKWSVDERALLGVFLRATRQGTMVLTWDIVCPHCRGVRRELLHLSEIPEKEECEACGIDFSATGLHAVEITFRVHPSVRLVEPRLYCAAEPATKPHILFKRKLLPGEKQVHPTIFPAGAYRLRIEGEKSYSLLDLQDAIPEKKVVWDASASPFETAAHSAPDLALENTDAEEHIFVVEENRADRNALRPGDLFTFQDFRDLFSAESVSPDLQLELGIQTVLFTDLVGSSRFYHSVGDAAAFSKVRDHFNKIFESVKRHKGAVVKTIGDAAMAAFSGASDALAAALEMREVFENGELGDLRIRISLHTGACLAVHLNSAIDYFGNAVNLAAKLQAASGSGEIVLTEATLKSPDVEKMLWDDGFVVEAFDFPLVWTKGDIVKAIRVKGKKGTPFSK